MALSSLWWEVSTTIWHYAFCPLLTNNIAHRALQNPALFTTDHYRQAAIAVVAGLAIRLIVTIPVSLITSMSRRVTLLTAQSDCRDQSVIMVHFILYIS